MAATSDVGEIMGRRPFEGEDNDLVLNMQFEKL